MNRIKSFASKVNAKSLAIGTALAVPFLAHAQASDPFTTTIADVTSKVTTYATALVTLAAVGVGFMVAVKYVKKIRSAA